MRRLIVFGLFLISSSTASAKSQLYGFSVKNIEGQSLKLSTYEGKVLLIVNTASGCGFTPQYKGLQELHAKYSSKGLVILGFPSNDFGGQEPGTDQEIKKFCTTNFNVGFPLFSKAPVSGKEIQPLFAWLTKDADMKHVGPVQWNFEKFLIGRDGSLKKRFKSSVTPENVELISAVESEIKNK